MEMYDYLVLVYVWSGEKCRKEDCKIRNIIVREPEDLYLYSLYLLHGSRPRSVLWSLIEDTFVYELLPLVLKLFVYRKRHLNCFRILNSLLDKTECIDI